MNKVNDCFVMQANDVETILFDWGSAKFFSEPKVTGAQRMSFGMVVLSPGKGHERHNHPGCDEIIHVLSGEGEQMLDDQPPVKVGPGDCIYIPQDIFHSTLNTGWEPMRLMIVYTPAGPEDVLRSLPGVRILPPGEVPA